MIRRLLLPVGLPLLALVALASATISIGRANMPAEVAQVPDGAAQAVPAQSRAVAALGRAEPIGGLRDVASEMTGTVVEMVVAVGSRVQRGDVLFRIDDRAALRRVAERKAELAAARAALARTEAQTSIARADLAAALAREAVSEAAMAEAARDLDVTERLADRNATAERDVERRSTALAKARAEREAALADMMRAEAALAQLDPMTGADLIVARAAVSEAEERLRTAESDLSACTVTAREDGTILSIGIREGETAGPSATVLTLAAGTEAVLRVYVNEVDAAHIDPAQAGRAVLRGEAERDLTLSFLAMEPEVRPNRELSGRSDDRIDTRVVEFLYRAPADAGLLFGQSFDVTLPTREEPRSAEAFLYPSTVLPKPG